MGPELPKTIIFMRHGIASDKNTFEGDDKDRPLTDKGVIRSTLVFKSLFKLYSPTIVVSSHFLRAKQTADIACKVLLDRYQIKTKQVETNALGVHTSWSEWQDFFASFSRKLSSDDILLVIGHEPSLSVLLARHLGLKTPIGYFKKAGIGIIEPSGLDTGKLVAYIPPKILRLKP